MTVTREQELWALTLHVERKHGEDAGRYLAGRIDAVSQAGEQGALDLWRSVRSRLESLDANEKPVS